MSNNNTASSSVSRTLNDNKLNFYHSLNYCIDFAKDWKGADVASDGVKETTLKHFHRHVTMVLACKNVSHWTELSKPEKSVSIPDKATIATKHLIAFLMLDSRFSKVPESIRTQLKSGSLLA